MTCTADQATAGQQTVKRALRPDDLFNLTMVGDVTLSPDGERICFVQTRMNRETNSYDSALWIVPADGTGDGPVQFTQRPGTVAQPHWSPDGHWLAFLADHETHKKQLWIIPTSGVGGEARCLTAGDRPVSDYTWAPDASRLAFVRAELVERTPASRPTPPETGQDNTTNPAARVATDVITLTRIYYKADGTGFINDRRQHLWTVDLDGIETRLTDGDHENTAPAWSPDARWLVFVSDRDRDPDYTHRSALWIVDTASGEARQLTDGERPVDAPVWSPDGGQIAFTASDDPDLPGANTGLWVISATGGEARNLTQAFDFSAGASVASDSRAGLSALRPVWAPDGESLYVVATVRGDSPLWRVPLDGGTPERLVSEGWQVQSFALAGDRLAYNLGGSLEPGNVYAGAPGEAPRRLTDVNADFFGTVELAPPEPFEFTGPRDWPIQGWLLRPPGLAAGWQAPLILEIHGGPHVAYGNAFMFEFQLLAAQGWGVLYVNPRGSTGYGQRFTVASNLDWGGDDYRDLMAGVDAALVRAPWVDRGRLGVTGGSYGGYMTNWIVTQTDRFRAAVTQRSICNMVSKWGTSDIGYFGNDRQWGGPPWERLDFYVERSPLTHVRNVVTPLLILHSERDLRCPIEQGEQFFTALKYLRREVEFARFPDEGHELSRSGQPLHRLERLNRIVGWFQRYLAEEGAG